MMHIPTTKYVMVSQILKGKKGLVKSYREEPITNPHHKYVSIELCILKRAISKSMHLVTSAFNMMKGPRFILSGGILKTFR